MTKKQSRIARPASPVNLPPEPGERTPRDIRDIDPRNVFRRICLNVLADPASTARERFEAMKTFDVLRDEHEPVLVRGFDAEVAAMSDKALDEALGFFMAPIGMRDPREDERELQRRRVGLEREFDARVEARARELIDMSAVDVHIEKRERESAANAQSPLRLIAESAKTQAFTEEQPQRLSQPNLERGWRLQRRRAR